MGTCVQKSERLEQELHHIGASRPSNHTIFVDDQAAAQTLDVAEYFDTPAELVQRVYNRPRRAQVAACDLPDIDTKDAAHAPTRCVALPSARTRMPRVGLCGVGTRAEGVSLLRPASECITMRAVLLA